METLLQNKTFTSPHCTPDISLSISHTVSLLLGAQSLYVCRAKCTEVSIAEALQSHNSLTKIISTAGEQEIKREEGEKTEEKRGG